MLRVAREVIHGVTSVMTARLGLRDIRLIGAVRETLTSISKLHLNKRRA